MKTHKRLLFLTLLIQINLLAQNPIIIPDTLIGNNFNLSVNNSTKSFYQDFSTNTIGINGNILGPTLIIWKGDVVTMNVSNLLNDTTTIHWHGLHVPAEDDGGPHTIILPGAVWQPQFTIKDNASTYWYHPHLHGKTAEQVTKGAAGFIIVRDQEESLLNLPRRYGVDDFPIVVQTRAFDNNKQFITKSELDSVILVNGTINPYLQTPAQIVRLRLLNGSTERTYNFGFTGNKQFYQIAGDGGLLDNPVELTRLLLAPGERAEVLINFTGMGEQTIYLMSYASELPNGIIGARIAGIMGGTLPNYTSNKLNGANFNILKLAIVNPTSYPVTTIPSTLIMNNPWNIILSNKTRTFTFTALGGMMNIEGPFFINGTAFNMETINFSTKLNNIEIWEIKNNTGIAHPFHVHGLQFYLLDRNGTPVSMNERGRKDNVLVLPLETVRFITKFEDYTNSTIPFMYHCHLLTHEDDGMMGQFTVSSVTEIDDKSPISDVFKLDQNYPNPFNPETIIHYSLSERSSVRLTIYNAIGQKVQELVNSLLEAGSYEVKFTGKELSSGFYFYKIAATSVDENKSYIAMKKMLYLK